MTEADILRCLKTLDRYRMRRYQLVMFHLLLSNPGVVSIDEIIEKTYWDDEDGGPEFAAQCIYRRVMDLRRRLGPGFKILNHQSHGYRLVMVEEQQQELKEAA